MPNAYLFFVTVDTFSKINQASEISIVIFAENQEHDKNFTTIFILLRMVDLRYITKCDDHFC